MNQCILPPLELERLMLLAFSPEACTEPPVLALRSALSALPDSVMLAPVDDSALTLSPLIPPTFTEEPVEASAEINPADVLPLIFTVPAVLASISMSEQVMPGTVTEPAVDTSISTSLPVALSGAVTVMTDAVVASKSVIAGA